MTVVLFTEALTTKEEADACARNFDICYGRGFLRDYITLGTPELVIPRYGVLPFAGEFYRDVDALGGVCINTLQQHRYLADLRNWYADLEGLTPETYFHLAELPECPLVLKGETNSKKHYWNTSMYAEDKKAAIRVACSLMEDSLIESQQIYARKYVPLVRYGTGTHGLPISEEYRFFVYAGEIVAGGYYWSSYIDDIGSVTPDASKVPTSFLEEVIARIGNNACFYTIDIAHTVANEWIVIELNDGQMAGLSCIDPDIFYSRLRELI